MNLTLNYALPNKNISITSLKKAVFRLSIVTVSVIILPSCLSHEKDLNEIYNKAPTTPIPNPSEPKPDHPPTNNKPEEKLSGTQSTSLGSFGKTGFIRDFEVADDAKVIPFKLNKASQLLPELDATVSNVAAIGNHSDFESTTVETEFGVPAAGGALPLSYTSTYKDFSNTLRVGHTNGNINATAVGYGVVPVDSVAAVGNATQAGNVPTDGQAKYEGDSTYRALGVDSSIEYGKSEFDVDFVNKSVMGTLTAGPGFEIKDGVITGNQFAATNTQGGFYGSDAKLLGGIYETEVGQGTFGASRNQSEIPSQPQATKSGVQSTNLGAFGKTGFIRDFEVAEDAKVIPLRVDKASQLLPPLEATVSDKPAIGSHSDFESMAVETEFGVPAAGGALPLNYTSVYKDFSEVMRIGHTNGNINATTVGYGVVPVDSVAVIGHATQVDNMPTDGQAKYEGDSTYRALGVDSSIEYGKSEFDVDFVNKSVMGTITAGPGFEIKDGVITGNQFSGTHTQGGFYGSDAKLLGGIYETEVGQGTFGAAKQ